MAKKSGILSLIVAIIFGCLGVISLPGFLTYFYRVGAGHAILEIVESENLQWDRMTEVERAPYLAGGKAEGVKCAVLMALGEHIPLCLFVLIIIGLLTPSIAGGFRVFLRLAFFAVWVGGMLLLSFGVGYLGEAPRFPGSLGPSCLIYLAAAMFFGLILGIGKLIQRATGKEPVVPPLIAEGEQ
jgi:hypothetical protein